MTTPYDLPSDPAKRVQPRAHRRPRPRARARLLQGDRLHRRGSREAARRRRDDLDRDDALQLQPARAGPAREGGHPRGRRDARRVQHDLRLRRRHDGHRGHARLARLARGHRRLDRARRARPPLRRARLPRRLRQDDPRRRHGARSPRHPRARPLRRLDRAGTLPRPRRDHPGRLRGRRRLQRRQDVRRGPARARDRRLPGRGRLRRPVHGEHHVDRARLPRDQPRRPERHPCRRRGRRTPPRSRRVAS